MHIVCSLADSPEPPRGLLQASHSADSRLEMVTRVKEVFERLDTSFRNCTDRGGMVKSELTKAVLQC